MERSNAESGGAQVRGKERAGRQWEGAAGRPFHRPTRGVGRAQPGKNAPGDCEVLEDSLTCMSRHCAGNRDVEGKRFGLGCQEGCILVCEHKAGIPTV